MKRRSRRVEVVRSTLKMCHPTVYIVEINHFRLYSDFYLYDPCINRAFGLLVIKLAV